MLFYVYKSLKIPFTQVERSDDNEYRFQYRLTGTGVSYRWYWSFTYVVLECYSCGTGKELICFKPNMAHYERTSVILIELAKVQNLI